MIEENNVKNEIEKAALERLKDYLTMTDAEFNMLSKDQIVWAWNRAKLSMQFQRELNLAKRSTEANFIRLGKLISNDKDQLKQYLMKTLPQYKLN